MNETYSIINDDYAVIKCSDGTRFYYGYEVTKGGIAPDYEDAEWCFEARHDDKIIAIYSASQLDPKSRMMGDMAQMLLIGISRLVDDKRFILK